MSGPAKSIDPNKPLEDLDHWEEFLKDRYPESESVAAHRSLIVPAH